MDRYYEGLSELYGVDIWDAMCRAAAAYTMPDPLLGTHPGVDDLAAWQRERLGPPVDTGPGEDAIRALLECARFAPSRARQAAADAVDDAATVGEPDVLIVSCELWTALTGRTAPTPPPYRRHYPGINQPQPEPDARFRGLEIAIDRYLDPDQLRVVVRRSQPLAGRFPDAGRRVFHIERPYTSDPVTVPPVGCRNDASRDTYTQLRADGTDPRQALEIANALCADLPADRDHDAAVGYAAHVHPPRDPKRASHWWQDPTVVPNRADRRRGSGCLAGHRPCTDPLCR